MVFEQSEGDETRVCEGQQQRLENTCDGSVKSLGSATRMHWGTAPVLLLPGKLSQAKIINLSVSPTAGMWLTILVLPLVKLTDVLKLLKEMSTPDMVAQTY